MTLQNEKPAHRVGALKSQRNHPLFRFNIGAKNNKDLRHGKPGASSIEDRLQALKLAHRREYKTSIGTDPLLDRKTPSVIKAVKPHVPNTVRLSPEYRLGGIMKMNGPGDHAALAKTEEILDSRPAAWLVEHFGQYKVAPMIKYRHSWREAVEIERPVQTGFDV